jgi:hypothetical protein
MTSETSAILSYALGKHIHTSTESLPSNNTPSSPSSPTADDNDDEEFFKENDPLTADYEAQLSTPPPKSKSRKFRICILSVAGVIALLWLGALIGYLSKGYFQPGHAPASPVAASRRITFDRVTGGQFYARSTHLEWTRSQGRDGVFLVRENNQIIREGVDGSKETVVDEHDVYYVFPLSWGIVLMAA